MDKYTEKIEKQAIEALRHALQGERAEPKQRPYPTINNIGSQVGADYGHELVP